MKILLTGGNGQLGRCLQDRFPADWQISVTTSSELDIGDAAAVERAVLAFQPDAIINAAAYTAVDKAESEPENSARVNSAGPENLARAARLIGARLVHVSTDYVFDGTAQRPYQETDNTSPVCVYGRTKLEGEKRVQELLPDAVILRTAWVFSEYGSNFVKTMLRLGEQRDALSIVSDQLGCPTYAGDIAQAIIVLLQQSAAGGIYHYCGDQQATWYDFAEQIFIQATQQGRLAKAPQLTAINTEAFPTPAQRPAYSVLDCSKVQHYGVKLSDWQKALSAVVAES